MNIQTNEVVLHNRGEFLDSLDEHSPQVERQKALAGEAARSKSALLWCGASKTVVSYGEIKQRERSLEQWLGYSTNWITVPYNTGLLCQDIRLNGAVLNRLSDVLAIQETLLIPYGPTWHTIDLLENLRSAGVECDFAFSNSAHTQGTVDFVETKIGFRLIHERLGRDTTVQVPPAILADGVLQLTELIDRWPFSASHVVVKGSRGAGSFLQFVVAYDTRHEIAKRFADELTGWPSSVFIIENLVKVRPFLGAPTVNARIHKGVNEIIGVTNHEALLDNSSQVDPDLVGFRPQFSGLSTIVGLELERHVRQTMFEYVNLWANELSQMGYTGWFCIDFLIDEGATIYATEVNCRRSGGSPLFDLKTTALGEWSLIMKSTHLALAPQYEDFFQSNTVLPVEIGGNSAFVVVPHQPCNRTQTEVFIAANNLDIAKATTRALRIGDHVANCTTT